MEVMVLAPAPQPEQPVLPVDESGSMFVIPEPQLRRHYAEQIQALQAISLEQLILETKLMLHTYAVQMNESRDILDHAYIRDVAVHTAAMKGISVIQLHQATVTNSRRLYSSS